MGLWKGLSFVSCTVSGEDTRKGSCHCSVLSLDLDGCRKTRATEVCGMEPPHTLQLRQGDRGPRDCTVSFGGCSPPPGSCPVSELERVLATP